MVYSKTPKTLGFPGHRVTDPIVFVSKSKSKFSKRKANSSREVNRCLCFVAFSFEIFIGGFNGHPETKLAKREIDNTFFEQKREETKSVVYSKTQKTLGFIFYHVA